MNHTNGRSAQKLRVLVADDDELIRELIVRILADAEHTSHAVDNGHDALTELAKGTYNLAVLDIRMPGPGVVEIVRQHRTVHHQLIPIIVLTANTTPETHTDCRGCGIDAVLTKPVTHEELINAIEKVAAGQQRLASLEDRPASTAGVLDEARLADLAHNDPEGEFQQSFLRKFIAQASSLTSQIEKAASEGNAYAIEELAHKLGASSGMVGAIAVENACYALRSDISQQPKHQVEETISALSRAVAEATRQLNQKYDIGAPVS
ncbi:MAG: response regulator [Gammaproteobacteria bacterium]|nr:response regulator [Gammaproteobacteria bacterium]